MKRIKIVVNICKYGSALHSQVKMKRVVLKSEPTDYLVECVDLDGCKSFNIFYNESRGLLSDLFAISDRMLQRKFIYNAFYRK